MPETQEFWIKYDGDALSDHTIDVEDLAPALLALPTLIQETDRIVNKDDSRISVRVGPPAAGSFEIWFSVLREGSEDLVDFFNSPGVGALTNATSLLWWGTPTTAGLIAFVRFIKGREARKVTPINEFLVEIEAGADRMQIPATVWELYQSPRVRAAFYQILKPLEKDGMDRVEFSSPTGQTAEVIKDEARYYSPKSEGVETLEELPPREIFVNVVLLWFRDGNKWRFSEGGNEWWAEIKDQDFIESLLKGEQTISANDFLKVLVKQTQTRHGPVIHSDYEILKVLEHKKVPQQMHLPSANKS
ncbi:MAG TPA: hypothetical protein VGJ73_05205 [Verrucomicrobiae bacterium]|jgi:hypothetical protein